MRNALTGETTTADSVRVRHTVLSAIDAHAQRDSPNECCGLLVGAGDLIEEAVPARNVLADPGRYRIDPREHIATNRRLRGTGRSVVGAYHSHPRSPAVPSPTDLAEAQYPEFVWLIVSLAGSEPEYRAYRIVAGKAANLTLIVEPCGGTSA